MSTHSSAAGTFRRYTLPVLMTVVLLAASSCTDADPAVHEPPVAQPPALLLGEFTDDYGNGYRITSTTWMQLPHGRLNIRRWHPEEGYLIAQNDSSNSYAPRLWTRVDWVELTDMAPWTWAYCLSAYEAPTAAAAASTTIARSDSLLVGCNGYPFTRMAAD